MKKLIDAFSEDVTSTANALCRLIETELKNEFCWLTREDLTEHRETLLALIQKRFAACFSRELIREVAAIQVDLLLGLQD